MGQLAYEKYVDLQDAVWRERNPDHPTEYAISALPWEDLEEDAKDIWHNLALFLVEFWTGRHKGAKPCS